jgi:hypothetical protein
MKAIFDIADAAHNIPRAIVGDGTYPLELGVASAELEEVLEKYDVQPLA